MQYKPPKLPQSRTNSLLLHVAEIALSLEALELVEGGGRGLVEQQGHGARLVGLGEQHGVAAQHHRLVLHLVPVHPGEHLGVAAVGGAVGDAVQQVQTPAGVRPPPVRDPRRCQTPAGERPPPVSDPRR
uniref:Uncharacterized protein n=1 Tax=Taeniopygia guttata TaxID=59729 RepID=A0A674GIG5_TAEGU